MRRALTLWIALLSVTALVPGLSAAQDPVAVNPDGDADAEYVAVSGTGSASTTSRACIPTPTGADPCPSVAASGTGPASCGELGCLAVSGTNRSNGPGVAASGTGEAEGALAASGLGEASGFAAASGGGNASGDIAVSGAGQATSNRVAVSGAGDTQGEEVAISGIGNSSAGDCRETVEVFCVAISGTGSADAHECKKELPLLWGCYALSGTGPATSDGFAANSSEVHGFRIVDVEPQGDTQDALVAVSGTGHARGTVAVSGLGPADGDIVSVSGADRSRGTVAVSLLGDARGGFLLPGVAVSGAGTASGGRAAVSLLGDTRDSTVGVSGLGTASARTVAVSLLGDAVTPDCGRFCTAISGPGTAATDRCEELCTAVSVLGDARAENGTGFAPVGNCEAETCTLVGVNPTGPSKEGAVAVSGTDDAEGQFASVSLLGPARGPVAASLAGDASCDRPLPCLAASGAGNASGETAASGLGRATGCSDENALDFCYAVSAAGPATGTIAISLLGSATSSGEQVCIPGPVRICQEGTAASGTWRTQCETTDCTAITLCRHDGAGEPHLAPDLVCARATKGASGGLVTASGTGNAWGGTVCIGAPVFGLDQLVCRTGAAASGTGDASGSVAVSGTGVAFGAVAVSGTGPATGWIALSGTNTAVALCINVVITCLDGFAYSATCDQEGSQLVGLVSTLSPPETVCVDPDIEEEPDGSLTVYDDRDHDGTHDEDEEVLLTGPP